MASTIFQRNLNLWKFKYLNDTIFSRKVEETTIYLAFRMFSETLVSYFLPKIDEKAPLIKSKLLLEAAFTKKNEIFE